MVFCLGGKLRCRVWRLTAYKQPPVQPLTPFNVYLYPHVVWLSVLLYSISENPVANCLEVFLILVKISHANRFF